MKTLSNLLSEATTLLEAKVAIDLEIDDIKSLIKNLQKAVKLSTGGRIGKAVQSFGDDWERDGEDAITISQSGEVTIYVPLYNTDTGKTQIMSEIIK